MANRFLAEADPTTAWAKAAVEGKLFTVGELVRHSAERHLRDIRDGERRGIFWRPEEAAHALRRDDLEPDAVVAEVLAQQRFDLYLSAEAAGRLHLAELGGAI